MQVPLRLSKDFCKAFLLSFGAIFLSTRVGILSHEYLGHGLGALVVGGEVLDHMIFIFHGGWVIYDKIPPGWEWLPLYAGSSVPCAMALGMIFIAKSRLMTWYGKILFVVGAGSFFQNAIYFMRSFHYGYGDGFFLYHNLSSSKDWWTLGTIPLMGILAWWWTPPLLKVAENILEVGSRIKFLGLLVIAFPLASFSFYILGEVELRWRDPAFHQFMRPLEARVVEERVVQAEREKEEAGLAPLSGEEIESIEAEVAGAYGESPYDLILALSLVLGCLVGVKSFLLQPMTDAV